jgi:hypothetical protein
MNPDAINRVHASVYGDFVAAEMLRELFPVFAMVWQRSTVTFLSRWGTKDCFRHESANVDHLTLTSDIAAVQ